MFIPLSQSTRHSQPTTLSCPHCRDPRGVSESVSDGASVQVPAAASNTNAALLGDIQLLHRACEQLLRKIAEKPTVKSFEYVSVVEPTPHEQPKELALEAARVGETTVSELENQLLNEHWVPGMGSASLRNVLQGQKRYRELKHRSLTFVRSLF